MPGDTQNDAFRMVMNGCICVRAGLDSKGFERALLLLRDGIFPNAVNRARGRNRSRVASGPPVMSFHRDRVGGQCRQRFLSAQELPVSLHEDVLASITRARCRFRLIAKPGAEACQQSR